MFKHKFLVYRRINITCDMALAGLVSILFVFAEAAIRAGRSARPSLEMEDVYLILLTMCLWPVLLYVNGLYPTDRLRTYGRTAAIAAKSGIQVVLSIMLFFYLTPFKWASPLRVLLLSILVGTLIFVKELSVMLYLHAIRKYGSNFRHVLVAGALDNVKQVMDVIGDNPFLGLRVISIMVPPDEKIKAEEKNPDISVRDTADISGALHDSPIDHVVLNVDGIPREDLESMVDTCEEEGVELWITSSVFHLKTARLDSDDLFGVPFFVFSSTPRFSWGVVAKVLMDKVTSAILIIISAPLVVLAGILIKATSSGPVFFKQERCGLNGRRFVLYKLRTMYSDAEQKREELLKLDATTGPVFKVKSDPRITPVGKFLRKTSIDEMPQFWNVFKGDMSLVGPRPPLPQEVGVYKSWHRRRLSMKPGITGLWQVSGRDKITDFEQRAELDLQYIDNWSIWLDLKIFLRTFFVVITGEGAG